MKRAFALFEQLLRKFGFGGASRDRTDDPLLAKQVLSQLSYGPVLFLGLAGECLVGLGGVEPPTSPLSGVRSNQLSYRPKSGLGLFDPHYLFFHTAWCPRLRFRLDNLSGRSADLDSALL